MLDERTRRLLAANEALALGYGGVSRVHRADDLTGGVRRDRGRRAGLELMEQIHRTKLRRVIVLQQSAYASTSPALAAG